MRFPSWLKQHKLKRKDRRGRHTKAERLEKIRAFKNSIQVITCRGCHEILDESIRTVEGDAIVCTKCGLVDDNVCFDHETPIFDFIPKSSVYRHKSYFAEKIRQARNTEPRLREQELDILSTVYNIYNRHCPVLWSEPMFTKKHAGRICRLIKRIYPTTQFHARAERWFQYRTYLCGNGNLALPEDIAENLRMMFDPCAYFFLYYVKAKNPPKYNITKLDLVTLVLLYNISYKALSKHGWYFLNKNILRKTDSIRKDMSELREVCKLINQNILNIKEVYMIQPECLRWFRAGNRLKVPKLSVLINMALSHPMGYYQYTSYCGNGHIPLLSSLSSTEKLCWHSDIGNKSHLCHA